MKYEAPSTDDRRIWDLWLSGVHQGAIVAADDAGVFSALAAAPATIEELAQRLNFDVRATGILMRLLGALDLLVQRDGAFHLTGQARLYLVKDSAFYWGNMMRVAVSEWHRDTALAKLKAWEIYPNDAGADRTFCRILNLRMRIPAFEQPQVGCPKVSGCRCSN